MSHPLQPQSRPRPRPSPRARRWLWLAFTGLLLAAQLTSVLQRTLVSHALCPQHGRFVHGVDEGSRPGAALESAEDEESHDHCALQTEGHEHLVAVSGPWLEFHVAAGDLSGLRAHAGLNALRALYRVAPKQSPPA